MARFINIMVDGFPERIAAGSSLQEAVERFAEPRADLITEMNGRFVPRREWASTRVPEGARLELIHAAFGG
jgi:thiamine biosynthesis protein ThiS